MEIVYKNKKVEKIFLDMNDVIHSKNLLQRHIGKERAITVKRRKNQIEAAPNFNSYLKLHIGNPHLLHEDLAGLYGVDIDPHLRLIIKPVSDDLSPESLAKCETVVLIGLVEYHGEKNEWLVP